MDESNGTETSNPIASLNVGEDIIRGDTPSVLDLSKTEEEVPVVYIKPSKNIEHIRENVRSNIAFSLLALLFVIVVFSFSIFVYDIESRDSLKDLITMFFAPIIGVLGTVLGFYFGAEVNKK